MQSLVDDGKIAGDRSCLRSHFQKIQATAGLSEPLYGFHDIRRASATMNADRVSANELQVLMRHASPSTTQRYINMARMLNRTAEKLDVPALTASGCVFLECWDLRRPCESP